MASSKNKGKRAQKNKKVDDDEGLFIIQLEGEEKIEPQNVNIVDVEDPPQHQTEAQLALLHFWPKVTDEIKSIRHMDLKQQVLPLARIKKIMKLDEDVKMISAEAPLLFAKAVEIFIQELTLRAWTHTEDNKRRTLQRNDIAMAISKYDQFDFLIDIVPRDDIKPNKMRDDTAKSSSNADQVHYYLQLAQQHHANLQQNNSASGGASTSTAAIAAPQTIQILQPQQIQAIQVQALPQEGGSESASATAAILQPGQAINSGGNIQIVQQIVTPNGEVQQIPIHLTAQQLQLIKMQIQSNSTQPVIIQTAPISGGAQAQVLQVATPNAPAPQVFLAQPSTSTDNDSVN